MNELNPFVINWRNLKGVCGLYGKIISVLIPDSHGWTVVMYYGYVGQCSCFVEICIKVFKIDQSHALSLPEPRWPSLIPGCDKLRTTASPHMLLPVMEYSFPLSPLSNATYPSGLSLNVTFSKLFSLSLHSKQTVSVGPSYGIYMYLLHCIYHSPWVIHLCIHIYMYTYSSVLATRLPK